MLSAKDFFGKIVKLSDYLRVKPYNLLAKMYSFATFGIALKLVFFSIFNRCEKSNQNWPVFQWHSCKG
jgi:hypothetical protein